MESRTKYLIIGTVLIAIVALMIMFGKPYKPEAPALTRTPEQIEQEDLVKKIQSGSNLWARHTQEKRRYLDLAAEAEQERLKVQGYVSGYRKVLCEKYNLVLSSSGALRPAANCGQYETAEVDFQ